MMDCPEYTVSKAVLSGEVYWGCTVGQKGGFAGSRRRRCGLGFSYLASHQRKCERGQVPADGKKDGISYGKSNTHLCRVYQIVAVTPCSGKGTANAAGKELHEVLVNL